MFWCITFFYHFIMMFCTKLNPFVHISYEDSFDWVWPVKIFWPDNDWLTNGQVKIKNYEPYTWMTHLSARVASTSSFRSGRARERAAPYYRRQRAARDGFLFTVGRCSFVSIRWWDLFLLLLKELMHICACTTRSLGYKVQAIRKGQILRLVENLGATSKSGT